MYVESVLRAKGNDVVTAKPETPVTEVARILAERKIGAVVISRNDRGVDGVLSERDIVTAIAAAGPAALSKSASELMTREVVTCTLQDQVADLMSVMTARRVRHIPVVEGGALVGIISIGDVVKCRVQEIEFEAEALRTYVTQG